MIEDNRCRHEMKETKASAFRYVGRAGKCCRGDAHIDVERNIFKHTAPYYTCVECKFTFCIKCQHEAMQEADSKIQAEQEQAALTEAWEEAKNLETWHPIPSGKASAVLRTG